MKSFNLLVLLLLSTTGILCNKTSADCNLSNASIYNQSAWVTHNYITTTCTGNIPYNVILTIDIPKCEFAILEVEGLISPTFTGIGIRPVAGMTSIIPSVDNIFRYKLEEGSFQLIEAITKGCPYTYSDRYRIIKYK